MRKNKTHPINLGREFRGATQVLTDYGHMKHTLKNK